MSSRAVVGAGVAAVALVAGLGAALVLGGDDDPKDRPPATPSPTSTTTESPPEEVADPLCVLYEELASTVATGTDVEGPAEFERFVTAQVTFNTSAAAVVEEADAAAFQAMADYWEAVGAFYSARGWRQQVDIADAALVPRPPVDGSASRTTEILVDGCGVAPPAEAPG